MPYEFIVRTRTNSSKIENVHQTSRPQACADDFGRIFRLSFVERNLAYVRIGHEASSPTTEVLTSGPD